MFRLTREVRFAFNADEADSFSAKPTNGHGGYPALSGLTGYVVLRLHFRGPLQDQTQYLIDIKAVDAAARAELPRVVAALRGARLTPAAMLRDLFDNLTGVFRGLLERLDWLPSPFVTWSLTESTMIRYSQKFEFSAAHRLHNVALTDEQNRRAFGKCNNPLGHGHNYEVQVTVTGEPDAAGRVVNAVEFETLVNDAAIEPLDHKFLNHEVPEFFETIPSVENIARVIFGLLKPRLPAVTAVTVWETPKTWCEYSEG